MGKKIKYLLMSITLIVISVLTTINNTYAASFHYSFEKEYKLSTLQDNELQIKYLLDFYTKYQYVPAPGIKVKAKFIITNDTDKSFKLAKDSAIQSESINYPSSEFDCPLNKLQELYTEYYNYGFSINKDIEPIYTALDSFDKNGEGLGYSENYQVLRSQLNLNNDDIIINPQQSIDLYVYYNHAYGTSPNNCSNGMGANQLFYLPFQDYIPIQQIKLISLKANGIAKKAKSTKLDLKLSQDIKNLSLNDIQLISNNKSLKLANLKLLGNGLYQIDIQGEFKQDQKISLKLNKDGFDFTDNVLQTALNQYLAPVIIKPIPKPKPKPVKKPKYVKINYQKLIAGGIKNKRSTHYLYFKLSKYTKLKLANISLSDNSKKFKVKKLKLIYQGKGYYRLEINKKDINKANIKVTLKIKKDGFKFYPNTKTVKLNKKK